MPEVEHNEDFIRFGKVCYLGFEEFFHLIILINFEVTYSTDGKRIILFSPHRMQAGFITKNNIMNKKILTLNNQFEAIRIKEILDVNEIPHMIRSFHDSAYDGVFQAQYGWGALEADEKDEAKILELIKEVFDK